MKIRTLIVDDEPPARELIATLLRDEPGVEIVGECSNGKSAIEAVERLSPDLMFLDIQMPGLDAFGALEKLPAQRWPLIVFVTAYDKHALRAFEIHALDYLLKPFEYQRLRESVQRAREALSQNSLPAYREQLLAFLEEMQSRSGSWDRLAIREPGRVTFIKSDEIDWIEAEGNYLRVHVGKKSHLIRDTMNSAETRLTAKNFLRINRSVLVNLERIREWQPLFHSDAIVILENGTRLTVSRVYRTRLDELMARLG